MESCQCFITGWVFNRGLIIIIIIIDNRGLNARWCLTPFLLSLPAAAYLGQRGLTPAGLSHTTAQCHLTILGEAVLFFFEPSIIPNTRVFIFLLSSITQCASSYDDIQPQKAFNRISLRTRIALCTKPDAKLQSITCHMGSHSVTCHMTQVNATLLNPS